MKLMGWDIHGLQAASPEHVEEIFKLLDENPGLFGLAKQDDGEPTVEMG